MTKISKSDPQSILDTADSRDPFEKVVRAPAPCYGAGFSPLPRVTVDTVSDREGLGPHGLVSMQKVTERRRIGSRSPFMHVRMEKEG
jgi:hypothetical protein